MTISTPFAEIDGRLEFPEQHWSNCRLSPRVLSNMVRVSDVFGVHALRAESIWDSSWRLHLTDLHPFPCVHPPLFNDVWNRLHSTIPRIDITMTQSFSTPQFRSLVNQDDELVLSSLSKDCLDGMHLLISLLCDSEVAVDDVTVMFRETESPQYREDTCSVCLDPMLAGQMCRRLACLHVMHAGCAMTLLPDMPSCPVCRSSIVPPSLTQEE